MKLHIPDGINFECTGCGNCCLTWPVPLTEDDFQQISSLKKSGELKRFFDYPLNEQELFRKLKTGDEKLNKFSYSLEKRKDGRCEFLSEEKRCLLQQNFGEQAKPAMCRMFPYTFTTTPAGVFASVSFASSGALSNFGRPLSEQEDLLCRQWDLFQQLFPSLSLDWSQLQLSDGIALSWERYLTIESRILPPVRALFANGPGQGEQKRVDIELLAIANKVKEELPSGVDLDKVPEISARPKVVDQLLVRELMDLYFPDDVFAASQCDLNARGLALALMQPPVKVELKSHGSTVGFDKVYNLRLGRLSDEVEQLFARYVYCRIFAKLYFGPGFSYLSLIAGINHLLVLVALVRMKLKIDMLTTKAQPDFQTVAELVRALERRLTITLLSPESTAMIEVLLSGSARLERIVTLAA